MRYIALLLALCLLVTMANAQTGQRDYVFIEDYYDTASCVCRTNGFYMNGTVALPADIGYLLYEAVEMSKVEEVMMSTMVVLENETALAVWLTTVNATAYIPSTLDPATETVGPSVSIVVYRGTMYIMVTTAVGLVNPSIVAVIDITPYLHTSANGTTALRLFVSYGLISGGMAYLEVAVWNTRVFASDISYVTIPFSEPFYVVLLADNRVRSDYSAYVDYTCVKFSSSSSRRIPEISIPVSPLVLPSAVSIWMHNTTHLVVSYTCYYMRDISECGSVSVLISDANMSRTYNITAVPSELFTGIAVYRGYVPIPSNLVLYRVCVEGTCNEGRFSLPVEAPLEGNQYTEYLFRVLPLAVVVALAAKTSGMKGVGLGLIGSGLVTLFLPWLYVTPPGVYAVSILLISLGIMVLTFYRE